MSTKTLEAKILLTGKDSSSAAFRSAAGNASKLFKSIERASVKIRNVGLGLTAALTLPVLGFLKGAIDQSNDAAAGIANVATTLKTMGGAAHLTLQLLQKMADDLGKVAAIDNDEILNKVTAGLVKFGHIHKVVFERAQKAIVDYAVGGHKDLAEATATIGRALQDPLHGMNRLTRAGIILDEQTKKNITTMMKQGRGASAQAQILAAVERAYKGQAAAFANTPAGHIQALTVAFKDLQQVVGGDISKNFDKLVVNVTKLIGTFEKLSPQTRNMIEIGVGLAAALGPVLVVVGSIGVAIAALGGPATLAIAAIAGAAVLIYENWGPIKTFFAGIAKALEPTFENIKNFVVGAWDDISKVWKPVGDFFSSRWKIISDAFSSAWVIIKPIVNAIKGAMTWIFDKLGGLKGIGGILLKAVPGGAALAALGDDIARTAAHGAAIRAAGAKRTPATSRRNGVSARSVPIAGGVIRHEVTVKGGQATVNLNIKANGAEVTGIKQTASGVKVNTGVDNTGAPRRSANN